MMSRAENVLFSHPCKEMCQEMCYLRRNFAEPSTDFTVVDRIYIGDPCHARLVQSHIYTVL